MSKAKIITNEGDALYTVQIQFNTTFATARIEALQQKLIDLVQPILDAELAIASLDSQRNAVADDLDTVLEAARDYEEPPDHDTVVGLVKQIAELNQQRITLEANLRSLKLQRASAASEKTALEDHIAGLSSTAFLAYCADYTDDLQADDEVALALIPGELSGATINIMPAYEDVPTEYGGAAWDSATHGQLTPPFAMTPEACFYNWAMLPGWQRWRPILRHGTITAINGTVADVTVNDVRSSVRRYFGGAGVTAGLNVNRDNGITYLTDVPASYMTCDMDVFAVGDEVILSLPNQDAEWTNPTIIGFKGAPRPCPIGNFGFLVMPRSDSDDGTGRFRDISPPNLNEWPMDALLWYDEPDSDVAYYPYVDYTAGNVDWVNNSGTDQISWAGGPGRYDSNVLAGTVAQWLTGQYSGGVMLHDELFDAGSGSPSQNLRPMQTKYVWRGGVRYDVSVDITEPGTYTYDDVLGAMSYTDSATNKYYFIVAYAEFAVWSPNQIVLYRHEVDLEYQEIVESTRLTSNMPDDINGYLNPISGPATSQPVFFNVAGTKLCTIARVYLTATGERKYYVITAEANSDRTEWTFTLDEECIKRNVETTTTTRSGSFGPGVLVSDPEEEPFYHYPSSYAWSQSYDNDHEAVFAVDWRGGELTKATIVISDVQTESKSNSSVTFQGDEDGPYSFALEESWGNSIVSLTREVSASVTITGGWSDTYTLSNYTQIGGGSIQYENENPPYVDSVSGSGSFSGYRRGILFLDLRYKHIIIAEEQESVSGSSAEYDDDPVNIALALDVTLTGTITKSINHVLFGESQTTLIDSYATSRFLQFAPVNPPEAAGEYVADETVSTTEAYEGPNGQWYGNSNWSTVATLADKRSAWMHIAVSWPAFQPTNPWSPSNADSRHWLTRGEGPLAPPGLSTIANNVDLSGSNPRFHAVRPIIIDNPVASDDAPE